MQLHAVYTVQLQGIFLLTQIMRDEIQPFLYLFGFVHCLLCMISCVLLAAGFQVPLMAVVSPACRLCCLFYHVS